jgi:hypothetical protein
MKNIFFNEAEKSDFRAWMTHKNLAALLRTATSIFTPINGKYISKIRRITCESSDNESYNFTNYPFCRFFIYLEILISTLT